MRRGTAVSAAASNAAAAATTTTTTDDETSQTAGGRRRRQRLDDLEGGSGGGPISYGDGSNNNNMMMNVGSPLFRMRSNSNTIIGADNNNMSMMINAGSGSSLGGLDAGMMVDDGYDSKQKHHRHHHRRRYHGNFVQQLQHKILIYCSNHGSLNNLLHNDTIQKALAGMIVMSILLFFLLSSHKFIIMLVLLACLYGVAISFLLATQVLSNDDGTSEMRAVSDPIRQGAAGFLHVQYTAIAQFAAPLALLIFVSYQFRPNGKSHGKDVEGVAVLGNFVLGLTAAFGFGMGALCSAAAGYVSMWVAAQSNIRVASASRRSYAEALLVCFRGGAFSAVLNLTLCIAGVTVLYTTLHFLFATASTDEHDIDDGGLKSTEIPMLLVGYGFGSSFVALFMQLGGGIYTKAADVGADLVGKVEQSIPEDDIRNPAVIADLVGDLVGDCVGSSADVFESVAAEIIGAMILGSTLATEAEMTTTQASKFVFFPLVVHAMDILVSSIGIAVVGNDKSSNLSTTGEDDPMKALQKGYRVALGLSMIGFFMITRWLLYVPENPWASWNFFGCGLVGMACAYVIVLSTTYFTDYAYRPVQSIAEASTTGHGTNIIVGVSVGMIATVIPTVTVAIAVLMAYHLGASTGIGASTESGEYSRNAGLFGTAVATMGMLSNAVYILSMNNFGPIADNAGGITEMSMQPDSVRDVTDCLDAAGNVTKAVTKGYSIGSASMACFLLFGAFMDEFSEYSGLPFKSVDIATPEVFVGGLIGSMMIFFFTGLAIAAVGRTAHEVVIEVRRQFKENPDILEYKTKPDYERCVALVTAAALREIRFPGLACVMTPIGIGLNPSDVDFAILEGSEVGGHCGVMVLEQPKFRQYMEN